MDTENIYIFPTDIYLTFITKSHKNTFITRYRYYKSSSNEFLHPTKGRFTQKEREIESYWDIGDLDEREI